ncbi:ATP-dependent zinc protease [Arcobacter arenosus]|uniref:ATP-dependent zinc protease family protein n=1 Tax=Arcobacter arenosus TaxID=2576037 RepID=UPI001BB0D868|nr:RimK/LysX family protein [Arcobacter arenosus]
MIKQILVLCFFLTSLYADNIVIGKYDRVDLPLLNLKDIRAKVDTGAKTSSLHCSFIESIDDKYVVFDVLDETHKKYENEKFKLPIKRVAKVRSSNGILEKRYVILTKVFIFGKYIETEFTLTNRKKMNYPILLGREFLKKGFIVDVRKEYISFKNKN